MKTAQRVVWTEGMFMAPQHLQQLDRYHENLVGARVSALAPYDWGVVTVQIDPRALGAGQLRVIKFFGVLPDGTPVAIDESHPELPPARPIEGHFPPAQRAMEVFLGVPAERDGVPNYANGAAPTPGMRFLIAPRAVSDITGGAAEVQVPFAQRNLTILFGDESRENYDAIKIAEVTRDATGALQLRAEYVPPVRRIGASPFVVDGLRRVLGVMSAKQRGLSESRRQRDGATAEFGAADVTNYLLLSAINTFIPVVQYMIDNADTVPPEDAFLQLSQFAGQLCAFAVESDPSTLPKFAYSDLGGTFEQLIERILKLLGVVVKARYIAVPLESREDGLHFGRLEDDRLLRTTTFILTVRSDVPEPQTVDQLPKLSKIASWSDVTDIVHAATPGVPLTVTFRPPAEIPVKSGQVYFQLNVGDRYWRNIAAERTIAIYLPPPFEPSRIKLELLAVPPAEAGAAR